MGHPHDRASDQRGRGISEPEEVKLKRNSRRTDRDPQQKRIREGDPNAEVDPDL